MALHHAEIREKLILVTLDLLDEGGLENARARTIASRAGVSVGTVYNLFGSVNGLLQDAFSRVFSALGDVGKASLGAVETELGAALARGDITNSEAAKIEFCLKALARVYVQFVNANHRRWMALLAFNRSRPPEEVADWYTAQLDDVMDIIGAVLANTSLGRDAEQRKLASRTLWSAVHGIVTMNMIGHTRPDAQDWTEAQLDLLITTFVKGLYAER